MIAAVQSNMAASTPDLSEVELPPARTACPSHA